MSSSVLLFALLGFAVCMQTQDPFDGMNPFENMTRPILHLNGRYSHSGAVDYASKFWNKVNHNCNTAYTTCTEYSYWGGDHCGYSSHGGDCANFVSQCLLAGGHDPLKGSDNCRGIPCGKEEIGATKLGLCLASRGWSRSCGHHMAPPASIKPGDVLVYHAGSCGDYTAHATLVVRRSGNSVGIACHSSDRWNQEYTYLSDSHPYYEWLHHE